MEQRTQGELTEDVVRARLARVGLNDSQSSVLFDDYAIRLLGTVGRNIENYIGTLKVPLGVLGPLRVNGARGDRSVHVPLATTEAALVASYARGAKLLTEAGGCTARVVETSISRAPVFVFESVADALTFSRWVSDALSSFVPVVAQTTRHGEIVGVEPCVEGNRVYVSLRFTTGDAAGQNMVTIATHALCTHIRGASPVPIVSYCIESNFSSDKKATVMSLLGVRGRRVVAEILLACEIIERSLHTTPEKLVEYWGIGAVGGAMSGQIGIQGHYANALAALYLATGQDVACVAESAVGITRFELRSDRSLYASVTMPNIIIGTVGGGTHLPAQQVCRDILQLPDDNTADALAEITAALCLAGELSISASICANDFAQAHQRLARG